MDLTEDNSGFIRRLFLRHVCPGVAAQVVSTIGPIVCGVIAGTVYGYTGLAVIGVFAPFFFLAGFFGTIIASGSSTLAAKYIALNDDLRVSGIYTLALGLSVLFAAVLFFLGWLFKDQILLMLVAGGELMELSSRYYMPSLWYTCLTVIIYMPLFWARLYGKPSIAMVLTVILTGASIILAVVFSFALGLDLESLAIAQALATVLAVSIALLLFHLSGDGLRLRLPQKFREDFFEMLSVGSPPGLSRLYRFLSIFIINAVLLNVSGAEAVAVFGVLNMLLRFVTAISNGISGVQMPIASVLNEERDKLSLNQLARISFIFGNAVILFFAVTAIVFSHGVAALFNIGSAGFFPALVCFCIFLPFYINGSLFISWYTAVRRVKLANIVTLVQDMVFPVLLVLIFAYVFGENTVWLHLPISGLLTALFLLLTRSLGRVKFIVSQTSLAFSVERNPGKASKASEAVGDFCDENGLDRRQSLLLSLAIEEMIIIIAEQNPGDDDVSVRLSRFDGGIVLRLRDAGRRFNPINFYKERMLSAEDIEDSVDLMGVKYITEAAEVVYYKETFGVNNLVVII